MSAEIPHAVMPADVNLPTELSKTLACFDKFPDGATTYGLTIPVYGDRPTFSAKDYADGLVGGTLTLYKVGDEHRTMTAGVAVHDRDKPMGLPVTQYGNTLEISRDLQAMKFIAYFITFRDNEPLEVMGITPDSQDMRVPDIGYSVFPGDRLSENHYFYYVMRFILDRVSKSKTGLHITNDGTIDRIAVASE